MKAGHRTSDMAGSTALHEPEHSLQPNYKNMHRNLIKTIGAAFAALLIASGTTQAGPGPQVFVPVKSRAEAESLPAKTKIAVTCPSCGAVSVSAVDKEKSHLHSFHCPSASTASMSSLSEVEKLVLASSSARMQQQARRWRCRCVRRCIGRVRRYSAGACIADRVGIHAPAGMRSGE